MIHIQLNHEYVDMTGFYYLLYEKLIAQPFYYIEDDTVSSKIDKIQFILNLLLSHQVTLHQLISFYVYIYYFLHKTDETIK
jgi:hypothetical protein